MSLSRCSRNRRWRGHPFLSAAGRWRPAPPRPRASPALCPARVKDTQGARRPRRHRHPDQRVQGDPIGAGRDQRSRRLRLSQHRRRHLHHPGRDAVVQDAAAVGADRQPGLDHRVGALTIDVGGTSEVVNVKGETPLVQTATGEKSVSIDPAMAAALPLNNRSYVALLVLAPGVNVDPNSLASQLTTGSANTNPPATRIGGGGDGNYMVDGVTTMDPGVNRPASRISAEAISEVKVDTFGYQAEYGRAERPADQRRHQERHEPVPRLALRRRAPLELGLRQQPDQHPERRSEAVRRRARSGAGRSAVRSASRAATTSCSSIYNQEFNPRTVGNRVFRYRMPTTLERAGRLLAVDRQPRQPVSVHQESGGDRHAARAASTAGLFRGRRRRSARFRRRRSIRRAEHPELVAEAELRAVPGQAVQLPERRIPT